MATDAVYGIRFISSTHHACGIVNTSVLLSSYQAGVTFDKTYRICLSLNYIV